jgi:hypothetical protein
MLENRGTIFVSESMNPDYVKFFTQSLENAEFSYIYEADISNLLPELARRRMVVAAIIHELNFEAEREASPAQLIASTAEHIPVFIIESAMASERFTNLLADEKIQPLITTGAITVMKKRIAYQKEILAALTESTTT